MPNLVDRYPLRVHRTVSSNRTHEHSKQTWLSPASGSVVGSETWACFLATAECSRCLSQPQFRIDLVYRVGTFVSWCCGRWRLPLLFRPCSMPAAVPRRPSPLLQSHNQDGNLASCSVVIRFFWGRHCYQKRTTILRMSILDSSLDMKRRADKDKSDQYYT